MPEPSDGISVVITVRNEGRNLGALFRSLVDQEGPFEVVIVDSESDDNTSEVIHDFSESLTIRHIVKKCTRGEGRNIGVENSSYPHIVFTDGDVIAAPGFMHGFRKKFMEGFELIAGEVIPEGVERFKLERVKLFYREFEITRPSANLGYSRSRFLELGGFDPSFITAEDIDLNLRAIGAGLRHAVCEECIAHNRTRSTYREFIRQAFWNGYGRRQLKRKNHNLWKEIEKGPKMGAGSFLPHLIRLAFGALGYTSALFKD